MPRRQYSRNYGVSVPIPAVDKTQQFIEIRIGITVIDQPGSNKAVEICRAVIQLIYVRTRNAGP